MQDLLRERWARDPVAFINDLVWTYDARKRRHLRHRPMVLWGQQPLFARLVAGLAPHSRNRRGDNRAIILKKSRDEGASVMAAALVVWGWHFHAEDHGVMTRAGYQLDGAGYNSLFGKIDHTIKRLPKWLVPWRDTKAGRDARVRRPPVWTHPENGAVIMGSTTVDGGWRGPRMMRIWVDEAAHIPQMEPILTSIEGSTDGAILISSVAGKGNCFYNVERGVDRETTDAGKPGDGWIRMEMHYRDNPSKDAEWVAIKRAGMTPEAWAREYEGDYSASAPGRIWPEYLAPKHVLSRAEWSRVATRADDEGWEILEGWDYGVTSLTATVWALYNKTNDVLYLADYGMWRERRIDEIARDVGAYGWACSFNEYGLPPHRRLGDPAGRNRDSMLTSPVANLSQYAINIQSQRIANGPALRDLIRLKISQDRVLLAPRCKVRKDKALPSLSDCLEQYRRKDPTGTDPTPKKDDYSHAADAFQYICASIWQHSPEVGMIYQQ